MVYREPAGLGICLRCRQSWNGWDLVCNECKTIDAIANQTSNVASGSGYSRDTEHNTFFFVFVAVAFFAFNYWLNWLPIKFAWILLKAGFYLFFGWWMGYSPSEIF